MKDQQLWQFAIKEMIAERSCCLIVIVDRVGSAANTTGAKMIVSESGKFVGTVGGGISEFQLVERAKKMLGNPELITFHHDENAEEHKSGAICSGSQTYALVPLTKQHQAQMEQLLTTARTGNTHQIAISSQHGFELKTAQTQQQYTFHQKSDEWEYIENLGEPNTVYMIGGGHISLALSRVFVPLHFRTVVLDNRENLSTLEENGFADHKEIVSYSEIDQHIPEGQHSYVAIMTFGHKSDELVLEKLLGKNLKYLGLLGSQEKVRKVFARLQTKGIDPKLFEHVHAPIGLEIGSDTPEEISISIAAEIIQVSKK